MSDAKTSLFELLIAVLLGAGALGGGWAGYQSSQWGGTATENYGKAATTATRGATLYNIGVTTATRDASLDIEAKQLVLSSMSTKDPLKKEIDMTVAKYLYTQHLSREAYDALGYPKEFYTRDHDKAEQIPEEALIKGLDADLDEKYYEKVLDKGNKKFAEADKIFAEGQRVSGYSTQFGLDGMFFTITLFLGGLSLVLKSHVRWGFMTAGYLSLGYAAIKLFSLPWYSS